MTAGYEPRFDLDRAYGEQGEALVEAWRNGSVEVKRKRRRDFKVYVETEQNARRRGEWRPSGIRVTTADYWDYVVDGSGVVIAVPTMTLRHAVASGRCVRAEERDGDNPTRGWLVDLAEVIRVYGGAT